MTSYVLFVTVMSTTLPANFRRACPWTQTCSDNRCV